MRTRKLNICEKNLLSYSATTYLSHPPVYHLRRNKFSNAPNNWELCYFKKSNWELISKKKQLGTSWALFVTYSLYLVSVCGFWAVLLFSLLIRLSLQLFGYSEVNFLHLSILTSTLLNGYYATFFARVFNFFPITKIYPFLLMFIFGLLFSFFIGYWSYLKNHLKLKV